MKFGLILIDGAIPLRETQSLVQAAERTGFVSFWVEGHLLYRFKGEEERLWDALMLLGALAAVISRIQSGPLVAFTSFRNSTLTTKIADTLDEISAGRFILRPGAVWHEPGYAAFGYHFDHRYRRQALDCHHSPRAPQRVPRGRRALLQRRAGCGITCTSIKLKGRKGSIALLLKDEKSNATPVQ